MNFIKNWIKTVNKWYESLDPPFKLVFTCCMVVPPFLVAFVGKGPVEAIGLLMFLVLGFVRGFWVFVGAEDEKLDQKDSEYRS